MFKVACTLGHAYQARPVGGRYRFKRGRAARPAASGFLARVLDGFLQRIVADRAAQNAIADHEQGRAGRAELAGEREVLLESASIATSFSGIGEMLATRAATALVSGDGRPVA